MLATPFDHDSNVPATDAETEPRRIADEDSSGLYVPPRQSKSRKLRPGLY